MNKMISPIRVAHVMGKMVGGGVEQVVMNYYRHIDRSRVQFDFLVDADSTLVPREEIESLGGRVFEIPPYQHVLEYQRELVTLFRKQGWQIVHSHINALSVFPLRAAKKAGVPVRIAHSHSTAGKGEHVKNVLKAILRTQSNRYPTHRMACSRYAGEWLFGKEADFEVIYNAIDLSRFTFDAEVRAEVRSELGVSDGQLAIGHVGRFMPQKNHRFLIEVFTEVAHRRDDSVLLLVGTGEDESKTKSKVDEFGIADRVMFLGQRNDVNRLYQAFDVFVLPSLYEGLGIVAIEAQCAGLPCFLSDQITREVDVTDTVRFLPICESILWADALCDVTPGNRITVQTEGFACYEINLAAQNLTSRYIDLAR